MGKLLLLGLFLTSLKPEYEDGSNAARRALLETDYMKKELKDLQNDAERHLFNATGMVPEDFVYVGYAYPVFAGRISTKPFRKFRYVTHDHWVIRPEIEYKFKSQSTTINFVLSREF